MIGLAKLNAMPAQTFLPSAVWPAMWAALLEPAAP